MKNITLKKVLSLLLLILFSVAVKAQTNVSGFISANTTWTLAGSPYIVLGNTLVSTGYTLTIERGVVVKLDTNKVLQIDGTLIAIGAPDERITFTSNQLIPKAGDWGKIHFADTCINAVFDSVGNYVSGCIMKYCDVMYGGSLGYGEIHIESSSPYFSHCNIINSSQDGIYCNSSSYLFDSSNVKSCTGYGLSFYNSNGRTYDTYDITIQNDSIENNQGGIYFDYYVAWSNKLIRNNYFFSNAGAGAIDCGSDGTENIKIIENYFLNNTASSPYGIISINGGANIVIQCNKFLNNSIPNSSVIYENSQGIDSAVVSSNLFDGNSSSSGNTVIRFNAGGNLPIYFTNNIIRNNSSLTGFICEFGFSVNSPLNFYISNNNFVNNSGLSTIHTWTAGLKINIDAAYIKYNNFNDVNTQYELYNTIPYGSPDIYADSNYWGSTSTQYIDSVIYDFFDYGNLSVVYYEPILTAPVVIDTSCSGGIPNGIKIFDNAINSKAFPNPFSTSTEVMFGKELRDGEVRIYNVFGQQVRMIENMNGDRVRIERGDLCGGMYIYEVLEKQTMVANGKLVVE